MSREARLGAGTNYYRVIASNLIGDTFDYTDPNVNEGAAFPTMSVDSTPSNVSNGVNP